MSRRGGQTRKNGWGKESTVMKCSQTAEFHAKPFTKIKSSKDRLDYFMLANFSKTWDLTSVINLDAFSGSFGNWFPVCYPNFCHNSILIDDDCNITYVVNLASTTSVPWLNFSWHPVFLVQGMRLNYHLLLRSWSASRIISNLQGC